MSNRGKTRHIIFVLVGIGFAAGALIHAGEGVASLLGYHLRAYPTWRHLLFFILDGGLAAVAVWRPRMLWAPLVLLVVQQSTTHGRAVWETWRDQHRVDWISVSTMTFVVASLVLAIHHRWSPGPVTRRAA